MLVRVFLVLNPSRVRVRVKRLLSSSDVHVSSAPSQGDLWNRLSHVNSDLVLVSRSLLPAPAPNTIAQLRDLPDRPDVVVLTAKSDSREDAELLAAGAWAVLPHDLPDAVLQGALAAIIRRRRETQAAGPRTSRLERPAHLSDFVSSSPAMQAFLDLARRVIPSDSPLLVLGETGVGKERLARAIHEEGLRSSGPFMTCNCAALPETLLESELFGHEEGSFTGATRARRGCFELAHRGTIFLDEIGEMPLHLQAKFLRVLQEYEFQRIGGERTISVDVRVIAATNRDLEAEMHAHRFRRDLYYRLAVVTLTVPPLRERREDIPELTRSYIEHFALRLGRQISGVSPAVLDALLAYDWPGNVRELINVVERGVLVCQDNQITPADLPASIIQASGQRTSHGFESRDVPETRDAGSDLYRQPWTAARSHMLLRFEKAYFQQLLERTRGRVGVAAAEAGIAPRSLFEKLREHGLRKEDYRQRDS